MMTDYATTLDNVLLLDKKLPEKLEQLRGGIHTKLDLNGMNPASKFNKEEVLEMLAYFLNKPSSDLNYELSQYIVKVYFHGDKDTSKYSI
jgi:hypothetical protein